MNSSCLPKLNEALFLHQGLIKLCVTGAMYRVSSCGYPMTGASTTQLEELTLLNCSMDTSDLAALMSYPKALKRFTFRGPRDEDLIDRVEEPWDYVDALIGAAQSLEYVDYDLYWGGEEDADFGELLNLKHLTTTISTLAGRECLELEPEFEVLPPSLESLTIRYDEVKAWLPSCIYELAKGEKLPNLRRFTCEIPEIIESLPSTNDLKVNPPATQICQEINTWQSKFAELNVELSAVTVPYPLEMPKYELCPCENLSFYHRMFYHMHDPLTVPWEDHEEDVFFGDWADIDDELDLDQIMDDLAESESSLTEGDFDDQ